MILVSSSVLYRDQRARWASAARARRGGRRARAAPRGATRTAPPSAVPARRPLQETPHPGLDTDFYIIIPRFNARLEPRLCRGAPFHF